MPTNTTTTSSHIRIAIPEPASPQFVEDAIAYNQRSLPQYLHAIYSAGATPIPIPLHESQERVARILATCHGIVLPGSGADVDPQKYGEHPIPACGAPDPARAAVDELLIQDAFNLHKPILAICHGAQSLNVWCGGSLLQDIPTQTNTQINHAPGRQITEAHAIELTPNTRLAALLPQTQIDDLIPKFQNGHATKLPRPPEQSEGSAVKARVSEPSKVDHNQERVNSSHHQAIQTPGDNLIVSAISPNDHIVEAVELASKDHWVVAVQWHPERTYNENAFSRAIFANFIQAAHSWTPRKIEDSVLLA